MAWLPSPMTVTIQFKLLLLKVELNLFDSQIIDHNNRQQYWRYVLKGVEHHNTLGLWTLLGRKLDR